MRAAAVVCTYGRASLAQLLACVERQTLQLPTLVWLDASWEAKVYASGLVEVAHGALPRSATLGAKRAAAVELARERFDLGSRDGVLILDDDDFYSSAHFAQTVIALQLAGDAGWTGGLSMGLTYSPGAPIEHVRSESGIGQQGTWAFRLDRYDAVGGYPDDNHEDIALAAALGFESCLPHWHTTHVRRQHGVSYSGLASFDPSKLRAIDASVARERLIEPAWNAECERFERWCATRPLLPGG